MRLVDTHGHVYDGVFDADRDEVIERALAELAWMMVVGDCVETSRKAAALLRPGMFGAVGVHPYHAASVDEAAVAVLRDLCGVPGVVALGEMGLDYHYAEVDPGVQRRAFCRQLDLAVSVGLPVVLHNRDSHADMADILDEYCGSLPGGVMHCFAGDAAFVERCVGWGFYVSFAGNVTYPKAGGLRAAAQATPVDRLLVETDCPYLAPQRVRGRRCEPVFVRYAAEAIAEAKGVSLAEAAEATTANANRLFGIEGEGR